MRRRMVLVVFSVLPLFGCNYDQLNARLDETQGMLGRLATVIDEEQHRDDLTESRRVELDNAEKVLAGIQAVKDEIGSVASDQASFAQKLHGGLDLAAKAGQGTPVGGAAEIGKILLGLFIGGGASQLATRSKIKSFNKGMEIGKTGNAA